LILTYIDQGAGGIGEEAGFAFAEAGASGVIFADINEEGAAANAVKSKEYATNPNYRAVSIKVDVTE
jgi:NAD(P)-dependent dehydrogenase (short-subunit alcohol dehydrogenase family)